MVFPVVMYGCESWTVKKAERRRIDAFEPWCWRRLLRVPWTAKRSNQSIQKEISPEYSFEGQMLKLKYSDHLMQRTDSLEKTLMLERLKAGGEGDDRGQDGWVASWTQWTWVWVDSRSWWWTGRSCVLRFLGLQRVGCDWATELNWTTHLKYNKVSNIVSHWNRKQNGGGQGLGWGKWAIVVDTEITKFQFCKMWIYSTLLKLYAWKWLRW